MTNKITTFIKQYFFILALAATFVGFSAFKFTEKKIEDPVWYTVQVINANQPQDADNLRILAAAPTAPPEESGDLCGTLNTLDSCMVRIDTENLSSVSEIYNHTIQEAEDDFDAPVSPEPGGDGYARSIE